MPHFHRRSELLACFTVGAMALLVTSPKARLLAMMLAVFWASKRYLDNLQRGPFVGSGDTTAERSIGSTSGGRVISHMPLPAVQWVRQVMGRDPLLHNGRDCGFPVLSAAYFVQHPTFQRCQSLPREAFLLSSEVNTVLYVSHRWQEVTGQVVHYCLSSVLPCAPSIRLAMCGICDVVHA